jgi:sRNA-binding protein
MENNNIQSNIQQDATVTEQVMVDSKLNNWIDYRIIFKKMVELYPTAIFFNQKKRKPLVARVHKTAFQELKNDFPDIKIGNVKNFFKHYCSSYCYLQAVLAEEYRIDLNGVQGEVITRKQKEYAKKMIALWDRKKNSAKDSALPTEANEFQPTLTEINIQETAIESQTTEPASDSVPKRSVLSLKSRPRKSD